ncbi:MAG: alginate export family protein [Candidatus Eisenbacteria bacterium]
MNPRTGRLACVTLAVVAFAPSPAWAADAVHDSTAAVAKADSSVVIETPFAVSTATTDSTVVADSLSGDVSVVTTVTTVTRVKRVAHAASGSLAAPVAAPVVAPVAARVAEAPAAVPVAEVSVASPAKAAPAVPPVVPGPRIALVSNGADPLLVRHVQQMLEKGGASVDVFPAPGGASPASAPSSGAETSASPAAFLGLAPPARTSAPAAAPAAPAVQPIAWEGQLRYRYEARTLLDYRLPGTFGRAATQTLADRGDVSVMRTRVGATLKLGPLVRGYFVLQDARTMGAEGSPSGTLQNVDLYHAYVDLDSIGARPLALRVGRQTLAYGEGRVLAGADWGNAGRAYDAARARWTPGRAQVDGFVAWINEGRVNGQDRMLSGVDALLKTKRGHELEAYHFRRAFGDAGWTSESGRKGALMDATSGARARVLVSRFEVRGEGAVQRGQRASDAVKAWFMAGRVTADLKGAWKAKVFGEYVRATGDEDPTDGSFQRFDPVYWGGHNFQGALDVAAAANLRDQAAGLALTPRKGWTLQAEGHVFRLDQARDAWLDDAGTLLRRSSAGAAGNELGREVDVTLRWETRGKVTVFAGASRFFAGDFVRRTGGGSDLNWGFLQLAVGF